MAIKGEEPRPDRGRRSAEALVDPFDEGEQTLIRPDFEPGVDLEWEEGKSTEDASERSEVEPREEVFFRECPNQRLRVISGGNNNHLWSSRARMR